MDGGKFLRNILSGSLLLGTCLLSTIIQAAEGDTLEDKLVWAVHTGDKASIQHLIGEGADVNKIIFFKTRIIETTPLWEAVTRGHLSILRLLLEQGADVNQKKEYDYEPTILHHAVSLLHHRPQVIKLLLDNGANPNAKNSEGEAPLVYLIKYLNAVNNLYGPCEKKDRKSFQYIRNAFMVLKLFMEYGADIHTQDILKNTLLHQAVPHYYERPNLKLFEELIQLGVAVNIENFEGKTALDLAIEQRECLGDRDLRNKYDQVITLLRKHGATAKDDRPRSPNPTKKIQTQGNGEDGEIAEKIE
jgi:ankyrin repeat protein